MSAYDNENVFAKILRGEIPSSKIYEDANCLAIMDVMPRTDGHCLVIPKNPSRNLFDIDPGDLCNLMTVVQKIAVAAKKAFKADGITIQQFNEPAAGQVVFHTHIHVLPRHEGQNLRPHTGEIADAKLLADQAKLIIAAL